ncbi:MAG: fumarylacetoacetate hydrolase family protein [Bacteroidota bacterium]
MKMICIGRNYSEHARELNNPVPMDPVFFMKPESAQLRNNQPFIYPEFSKDIHYETELVLHVCKVGRNIQEKFAASYFDGIGVGIDFTARDLQQNAKEKGLPWEMAKAFDFSAPVSRFLPLSEFQDTGNIRFGLYLNGQIVQDGNSADMIFSFDKIIAYISRFITLKQGDYIFTGTPAGVGPVNIGDRLEAFIGNKKLLLCNIR